jgi:hypothetical protein
MRAICSLSHTIREPLSVTCVGNDEQPVINKAPLKARISFMAVPPFAMTIGKRASGYKAV